MTDTSPEPAPEVFLREALRTYAHVTRNGRALEARALKALESLVRQRDEAQQLHRRAMRELDALKAALELKAVLEGT